MRRGAPAFRWENGDLIIAVKVQPRAAANAWSGLSGDHFRVRVAAPPVDGKANDVLLDFIAAQFDVSRSRVEVISGDSSRIKRLRITKPSRLAPGITPPG